MGFPLPKILLFFLQLSFLVLASHSAYSTPNPVAGEPAQPPSYQRRHHHHHHGHYHHKHPQPPTPAPTYPPVKPPVHPPVKPPVHPPVKPPVHPPVKPPTKPPVQPPVKPPTKPPTYPPVKPPVHPPTPPPSPSNGRVAVQGQVYCKNCSYLGVDTLTAAKPLVGAKVVMRCKINKSVFKSIGIATTDKNGYFLMKAPKSISSLTASSKCRVYLLSAPFKARCNRRTNLNGGVKGGVLTPLKTFPPLPFSLFNVGPFAFEPPRRSCHKN